MENNDAEAKQCCPPFDPVPWEGKEVNWENKLFIKDAVAQFLHIPLPWSFGKTVVRMFKKIEDAGAQTDTKDFLMLAYDPSPWRSELYMNVTKEVPGADNVRFSGTYLTRVFEGPYNAVPRWIAEMDKYAAGKGKKVNRYYFYYTTCPKCAKKYGKNYVVVFAQV